MIIQQEIHIIQIHLPKPFVLDLNTTDEMFVIYYVYTMYQNGDENLDLDSLMMSGMTNISELILKKIMIYPSFQILVMAIVI